MPYRLTMIALGLWIGASACKKPEDKGASPAPAEAAKPGEATRPAGCGPLTVTADGAAVPELRGLAVTLKNGEYETEQVELYDTDKITCAEVLAPIFPYPEGTLSLRAYYHPQAQGLGTEAYTEMGVRGITLVAKAAKVGDDTSICVPAGSTFTPNAGSFAGKKLVVAGTMAGKYCGVKDMNAH